MPLILALEGQRQSDLCEFEASLVNIENSRPTRAIERDLISKRRERKKRTL